MGKISARIPILVLTLILALAFGTTAFAFTDVKGDPGESSIMALKEKGLIGGMGNDMFVPKGKMSYGQAVHLTVKALGLNIDNIRFIKEPKAGDYFTNIPDDAWYAGSFIIAQLNGLPVPKDVNPDRTISREQFAALLYHGLLKTGASGFGERVAAINDADQIDPACTTGVQALLNADIAKPDDQGNFRPRDDITRSEAAVMTDHALAFLDGGKPGKPDDPAAHEPVTVSVERVTDEVSRVTVYWGEKPNPGYRVTIEAVEFRTEGTALVKYKLHTPDPGKMYPALVTAAKAVAYVPGNMKVATEQVQ